MINEIGYCISSLRKKREIVDRDLFVVEKLRRHYGMNEELTAKMRAYIAESKPDPDQVLPEEEQGILLKLNEEIREGTVPPTQTSPAITWPQSSVPPSFSSVDGRAVSRTQFRAASFIPWRTPTTSSINPSERNAFTSFAREKCTSSLRERRAKERERLL